MMKKITIALCCAFFVIGIITAIIALILFITTARHDDEILMCLLSILGGILFTLTSGIGYFVTKACCTYLEKNEKKDIKGNS